MGAAYEAPEMAASKLDRAMAGNAPYIENINFRGITMPDYLHGRFRHCTFSDCDFSGTEISATFDDCSLYDMSTKGMKIGNSEFQDCTIANTKFEDCELSNVVFSLSDIRQCSAVRTKFENCRFEHGTIDRVFFHQGIKAHGIEGLESMKITMGGATEQEAANHARQICEALTNGTPDKDAVMPLKTPVRVEDEDYGYMVECKTFEEYARAMQFPDPTDVVIPIGTQNLITDLINEGKIDISEAFSTCRNNYQYDNRGREYIEFPSEAEMIDILKTCKSYKRADPTRMADQLAAARHQAAQERSENRKERSAVHDNR